MSCWRAEPRAGLRGYIGIRGLRVERRGVDGDAP